MDIFNDVITAQKLHDDQDEVFDDVLSSRQPKVIVYENQPSLVLMSAEVYRVQIERLIILAKIEEGRKAVKEGRVVSNDVVIADLQRMMAETEAKLKNAKS